MGPKGDGMADKAADSTSELRNFTLQIYPRPGVSAACIDLQDRKELEKKLRQ